MLAPGSLGLRSLLSIAALAAVGLVAAACGDDGPSVSTTGGQGGSGTGGGGTGGDGAGTPGDKPTCLDPDQPASAVPDVRADSAAALSADGTAAVLFGGDIANVVCPNIPPKMPVADTWVLDVGCGQWTELQVAGPSARSRHSMVSDHSRNRALSFGGRWRADPNSGSYTLYNDVWAFDFASQSWSEIATTGTGPEPRYNASLVMAGDEMIVFGGGTATSATSFDPVNTVYALNLTTNEWRQITPAGAAPAPRLFHSATYDPVNGRMFIGYGSDNSAFTTTQFFQDQWALDLATSTWHELQIAEPLEVPYGRIKGAMFFRPSTDGVEPDWLYQFAGHDDAATVDALGNRNDVLAVPLPPGASLDSLGPLQFQIVRAGDVFESGSTGTCQFPANFVTYDFESPERRSAFAFSTTADGLSFFMFGGDSDCDRLSDSWWFNTSTGAWSKVRESLPGLTCPRTNGGDLAACAGMCG
ncbi:MAG: kelch repeat-containing protein [Polyangiaceae bacterium]